MWMTVDDCAFGYRTSRFKREPNRWVVLRVRMRLDVRAEATVKYAEVASGLHVRVGERAPLAVIHSKVLELRAGKGMVLRADDPDSVSAGSFFTNPSVDREKLDDVLARAECLGIARDSVPVFSAQNGMFKLAAAWLIERAGIQKGYALGQARVSTKHVLALVNAGGATTRELLELAAVVQGRVEQQWGIALEREPVYVA